MSDDSVESAAPRRTRLLRVAEHVRTQNWTAIGIDFCIVVLGVFVGIQVSNWNGAQHDRKIEQQYLERLRVELADIVPLAQSAQTGLSQSEDRLEAVRAFFESGQGGDTLDGEHCAAVARSHIFSSTIFYPPTIKELISTGRILLISDPHVRTAIMSFDRAHADISQLRTDVQIDRRPLARHHPDLINLGASSSWTTARCDFRGMRGSPAFLNDFTDNVSRFRAFSATIGEGQAETLAALATTLDGSSTADERTGPQP